MSKTFLFAGASSAIAKEAVKLLHAKGFKVIGISRKPVDSIYDEFYEIEKYDFGNFPSIDNSIDGLVYFPGTINLKPFHRISASEFQNDFFINVYGAMAFMQAYLTNLKAVESSSVVFISSVAADIGLPFHSSISASKSAIQGLTKALAAEYAPKIRVNCIAPSLVKTPLADKFINTPEKLEQMQIKNPLRKVGTSLDIANAISFLLTAESNWITGQIIAVDGGMGTIKNS